MLVDECRQDNYFCTAQCTQWFVCKPFLTRYRIINLYEGDCCPHWLSTIVWSITMTCLKWVLPNLFCLASGEMGFPDFIKVVAKGDIHLRYLFVFAVMNYSRKNEPLI